MIDMTPEQKAIRDTIRAFSKKEIKPVALKLDQAPKDYFCWDIVKKGAQVGLLTAAIPEEAGGAASLTSGAPGSRFQTLAIVMEELAWGDAGVATIFGAHGLGISPILATFDRKKWERFLTPVARAALTDTPKLAAFAITEPNAGSDVEDNQASRYADLMTIAKPEGHSYVLTGRKCFISNGSVASLFTVFATLDRAAGVNAWTCFVVTPDMEGFSVGRIEDKMGQRACPAAELVFDEVRVPRDNLIGGEGNGWKLNQMILNSSRAFVGAVAVGIARNAYEIAFQYALTRKQGGKSLIDHQMIQHKIADMAMLIEVARTYVWQTCRILGSRFPPPGKEPAIAKLFASEAAFKICNEAIQILGGYGYMREYEVEKCLRDARLTQIYEGTSEIQRLRIVETLRTEPLL